MAVAGHDGRCFTRDRGGEDGIVVDIPRDAFDCRHIHDFSQQLDLRAHRSCERSVVGETNYEDFLELVHENDAGDERELTAKDPC